MTGHQDAHLPIQPTIKHKAWGVTSMSETDLENITISVKLSDLDTLAYYIVEIDESKGNRKATQVSVDNAHKKIMGILGEHTHLIYQPDE